MEHTELKIHLVGKDQDIIDAWREQFSDLPDISIHAGSILGLKVDAIVSPANSFGFMDGGLDLQYTLHFGPNLQTRIQTIIKEQFDGELLIGQSAGIATDNKDIPYIICSPTMRIPMVLDHATINPYLATKSALSFVNKGWFSKASFGLNGNYPVDEDFNDDNRPESLKACDLIKSIAFPAMGFGIGKVPAHMCARQMKQAILDTRSNRSVADFPKTWRESSHRHMSLLGRTWNDQIKMYV